MTDYYLGPEKFPAEIELCGTCARRLHRIGPERTAYCEKCGHGSDEAPVTYARKDRGA